MSFKQFLTEGAGKVHVVVYGGSEGVQGIDAHEMIDCIYTFKTEAGAVKFMVEKTMHDFEHDLSEEQIEALKKAKSFDGFMEVADGNDWEQAFIYAENELKG